MSPVSAACGVRRTARRRLALAGLGIVVFLAAAALLRSVQGPLKAATIRAQVEAFLAEKDDVDAVFIGSSRVQRGVSPRVVDEKLSTPEREFRSFNLGIAGMRSFEADWLVRRILDAEPARLRFVVIEAPDWKPEHVPQHDFTERYVDWHDARATWLVLRAIWKFNGPWYTKLELSWRNLRFFAMRSVNYATKDRLMARADPAWDRLVAGRGRLRGYQPLDEDTPRVGRRRRRFLENLDWFEKSVADIRAFAEKGQLAIPGAFQTYDLASIEEQVERVREAGATPVYFAAPGLARGPDFSALQRDGVIEHLIDLRDPSEHPDLFAPENRFDREHMNEEGARLMSERIAAELAPIVAGVAAESTSSSRGSTSEDRD